MNNTELANFIEEHTRDLSLRDGTHVRVRPIGPDDKQDMLDGLARLSPESRYRRFMTALGHLSEERLRYLTEIDYHRHFAWAAFALDEPGTPGIAVARYVCDAERPEIAEPALAIIDDYQHRGLGTLLLSLLTTTAVEHGVKQFRASLLAENQPMYDMLKHAGAHFKHDGLGVLTAEIELPDKDRARFHLLREMVRHACEGAVARARGVFHGQAD